MKLDRWFWRDVLEVMYRKIRFWRRDDAVSDHDEIERLRRDVQMIQDVLGEKRVALFLKVVQYRKGMSLGDERPRPISLEALEKRIEELEKRMPVVCPGEDQRECGQQPAHSRPRIVCLCGSTRFKDAFAEASKHETLAGRIVLSVGLFGHLEGLDMAGPTKKMLDELHLRKIDLADEVLVLNVGGYIGESTRREIEYARKECKPIRYAVNEEAQ